MKRPAIEAIGNIITVKNVEMLDLRPCMPTNVNMLGRTNATKESLRRKKRKMRE